MKLVSGITVAVLACAVSPLLAQLADCNTLVVDQASVIKASDLASINTALASLTSHGADPRVITTNSSLTEEQFVSKMKDACPSWRNPNSGVKNNLIVFIVSPNARKMGIFIGDAYKNSLSNSVTTDIKDNYMGPYFKAGEWGTGLIEGVEQTTNHIIKYESAALQSNTGTTIIKNEQF